MCLIDAKCSVSFCVPMIKLDQNQAIETVLKDAKPDSVFLFDCDGTLIRGDINNACFRALLPLGLIDDQILPNEWQRRSPFVLGDEDYRALDKLLLEEHGSRGYFEWEVKAFRGLPRKTVRETARSILLGHTAGHNIETHFAAWHLASKVKDQAWIVSGSERSCIEAVADLIGIDHNRVVATELQEVDGIMNSAFEEPGINWEENKVKSLKKRNIESAFLCAGDSTGDWELLGLAKSWRWCVVEIGENSRPYKRIFRDRILDELKISADILELGFYAFDQAPGLKTLLQVVNVHE
jgi:phosphoserine phosphatase